MRNTVGTVERNTRDDCSFCGKRDDIDLFMRFEYYDWLLREQERKQRTQFPQWAVAERLDYVDSFMESGYSRFFTRDRAASSAIRVKSGCSCKMEPGA